MSEKNSAYYYLAFEEYRKDHPEGKVTDLGFRQFYASKELDDLKVAFYQGEVSALLNAIFHCAASNLPLPEWVSSEFIRRHASVTVFCKHKSWDDVFGKPFPKGVQLSAIKKDLRLRSRVYWKVEDLSEKGESITEALFEKVGGEFGVGKTKASEYYYNEKDRIKEFHEILKNHGITD